MRLEDRIESLLSKWTDPTGPGIALAVVKSGNILFRKEAGLADPAQDVPLTSNTRFHIASITKTFTALACLLLEEQGLLSMDSPVSTVLPELHLPSDVTPRHLLNMTSGLCDTYEYLPLAGLWPDEERTIQDHLTLFALYGNAVNTRAGEKFLYSNTNFLVIGRLIEALTGERFENHIQRVFFDPLGMGGTLFRDRRGQMVKHLATPCIPLEDGGWDIGQPYFQTGAAAGLVSTLDDLLIWLDVIRSGQIGTLSFSEKIASPATLNDGISAHYAMGFWNITHRKRVWIGHTGKWYGYNSAFLFCRQEDLGIVLLSNTESVSAESLSLKLADLVLESPESQIHLPSPPASAPGGLYMDPETGESVDISPCPGGIRVKRYYLNLFIPERESEIFATESALTPVEIKGSGPTISVNWGGHAVEYQHISMFNPVFGSLKDYAGGRFVCHSPAMTHTIFWDEKKDSLMLRCGPVWNGSLSLRMTPVCRDVFTVSGGKPGWVKDYILKFRRDPETDLLVGYTIHSDRLKGVVFDYEREDRIGSAHELSGLQLSGI